LNTDSELEPEVLAKTGELLANQFETKFALCAQLNHINTENLSEDCINFILGYLTSTATTVVRSIGGRPGSTDSKNLILIIFGNLFTEGRSQKLFEYTIKQMQTENKNSNFLLGLNAGGPDACAFINKEQGAYKNLMNYLSGYSP
jgi:hypothetical protein